MDQTSLATSSILAKPASPSIGSNETIYTDAQSIQSSIYTTPNPSSLDLASTEDDGSLGLPGQAAIILQKPPAPSHRNLSEGSPILPDHVFSTYHADTGPLVRLPPLLDMLFRPLPSQIALAKKAFIPTVELLDVQKERKALMRNYLTTVEQFLRGIPLHPSIGRHRALMLNETFALKSLFQDISIASRAIYQSLYPTEQDTKEQVIDLCHALETAEQSLKTIALKMHKCVNDMMQALEVRPGRIKRLGYRVVEWGVPKYTAYFVLTSCGIVASALSARWLEKRIGTAGANAGAIVGAIAGAIGTLGALQELIPEWEAFKAIEQIQKKVDELLDAIGGLKQLFAVIGEHYLKQLRNYLRAASVTFRAQESLALVVRYIDAEAAENIQLLQALFPQRSPVERGEDIVPAAESP